VALDRSSGLAIRGAAPRRPKVFVVIVHPQLWRGGP